MPVTNAQDMAKAGSLINSDGTTVSVAADLLIADKIVHSGDTNTAIRFPAADTVTVETAGAERVRVDSSGNVGIGSSSPSTYLASYSLSSDGLVIASGGIPTLLFTDTGSTTYSAIGQNGTTLDIYNNAAGSMIFYTNGSQRLRIDSDGNVGIGTNNPTNRLTVRDSTDISMDANGSGQFRVEGSGYSTAIAMDATGTFIYNNGSGRVMAFGVNEVERLRIDSSGRVGIGTNNPVSKLTIQGGFSDQIILRDNATNSQDKGATYSGAHYTNAEEPVLVVGGFSTNTQNIVYVGGGWSTGNTATDIRFFTAANNTTVTGTERLRITSGGEVYIAGTTDQGAYNLQVNGTGVWGAGAYVNGSDERLKENIQDITSGLDVVEKLRPVSFQYKEEYTADRSVQSGFIAQDLLVALEGKNYLEGIVSQGPTYYNVAYQNLIPILAKAIQELKTINNSQAQTITSLESRITALEAA